jgi:hypothetical protein
MDTENTNFHTARDKTRLDDRANQPQQSRSLAGSMSAAVLLVRALGALQKRLLNEE